MSKKIYTEEFQKLEEFIQKVNDIVTPISFRDELKSVMDKETRKRLCEKFPKCYLPVNMGNSDAFILPVCNRNGATDKNMIAFSLKLANKLLGRKDVDRGMLEITIKRLERMNTTYSKDIPTPPDRAALKANTTKEFSKIRNYLNNIQGK